MTTLQKRVLELSYKYKLSHISSCLNTVDYIDYVYSIKDKDDVFVLSNGHAGLALYVVLEKYGIAKAEDLIKKHGTHPNKDFKNGIFASTGSLGLGLPITVGMALANRNRNVYVTISDGECAEGSVWEALKVAAELHLENLRIACIANGLSAYSKVDLEALEYRLKSFYPLLFLEKDLFEYPEEFQGLKGHYFKLTKEVYEKTVK